LWIIDQGSKGTNIFTGPRLSARTFYGSNEGLARGNIWFAPPTQCERPYNHLQRHFDEQPHTLFQAGPARHSDHMPAGSLSLACRPPFIRRRYLPPDRRSYFSPGGYPLGSPGYRLAEPTPAHLAYRPAGCPGHGVFPGGGESRRRRLAPGQTGLPGVWRLPRH
jgi:hypothetical protein